MVRGTKLDAEARVTLAHELTPCAPGPVLRPRPHPESHRRRVRTMRARTHRGRRHSHRDGVLLRAERCEQRAVDRAESGDRTGDAGAGHRRVPTPRPPRRRRASWAHCSMRHDAGSADGRCDPGPATSPGLAHAFRHPPRTQLQFLVPIRALDAGRVGALTRPRLAHGARRLAAHDPDDFGAVDLYFLLASRLGSATALRAADAWSNGKELISRNGDRAVRRSRV